MKILGRPLCPAGAPQPYYPGFFLFPPGSPVVENGLGIGVGAGACPGRPGGDGGNSPRPHPRHRGRRQWTSPRAGAWSVAKATAGGVAMAGIVLGIVAVVVGLFTIGAASYGFVHEELPTLPRRTDG